MKLNVFVNGELVLEKANSEEVRRFLQKRACLTNKDAKFCIRLVFKTGSYISKYLRIFPVKEAA